MPYMLSHAAHAHAHTHTPPDPIIPSALTCTPMQAQEVPFSIFSWQHWDALFRTFSASVRRMAHALGVTEAYITSQCSGRRSHAHAGERHARLAAACAVELLLREKPARQVADVYGHPDTITKAGLSLCQSSCHEVAIFFCRLACVA